MGMKARGTPDDPLLTIDDVAELLAVEPRFVRRLVQERRIPFHKIGKFVRFGSGDIRDFIESGRMEATRSGADYTSVRHHPATHAAESPAEHLA